MTVPKSAARSARHWARPELGECGAIGAGVLIPRAMRPALAAGIVIALAIWVAGENFGAIFTGRGTDPSTGPLLILLAATCWPRGTRAESGRQRIVRM